MLISRRRKRARKQPAFFSPESQKLSDSVVKGKNGKKQSALPCRKKDLPRENTSEISSKRKQHPEVVPEQSCRKKQNSSPGNTLSTTANEQEEITTDAHADSKGDLQGDENCDKKVKRVAQENILENLPRPKGQYNCTSRPQLLGEDILCDVGLAFMYDSDSEGESETDPTWLGRFSDRPNIVRWGPRAKKSRRASGNSVNSSQRTRSLSQVRYRSRITYEGASINLGNHISSTAAAAVQDLAYLSLLGSDYRKPMQVLSRDEAWAALKAVGMPGVGSCGQVDAFCSQLTEQNKVIFEGKIEEAISSIGGQDDVLADILSGLDLESFKAAEAADAAAEAERLRVLKREERKKAHQLRRARNLKQKLKTASGSEDGSSEESVDEDSILDFSCTDCNGLIFSGDHGIYGVDKKGKVMWKCMSKFDKMSPKDLQVVAGSLETCSKNTKNDREDTNSNLCLKTESKPMLAMSQPPSAEEDENITTKAPGLESGNTSAVLPDSEEDLAARKLVGMARVQDQESQPFNIDCATVKAVPSEGLCGRENLKRTTTEMPDVSRDIHNAPSKSPISNAEKKTEKECNSSRNQSPEAVLRQLLARPEVAIALGRSSITSLPNKAHEIGPDLSIICPGDGIKEQSDPKRTKSCSKGEGHDTDCVDALDLSKKDKQSIISSSQENSLLFPPSSPSCQWPSFIAHQPAQIPVVSKTQGFLCPESRLFSGDTNMTSAEYSQELTETVRCHLDPFSASQHLSVSSCNAFPHGGLLDLTAPVSLDYVNTSSIPLPSPATLSSGGRAFGLGQRNMLPISQVGSNGISNIPAFQITSNTKVVSLIPPDASSNEHFFHGNYRHPGYQHAGTSGSSQMMGQPLAMGSSTAASRNCIMGVGEDAKSELVFKLEPPPAGMLNKLAMEQEMSTNASWTGISKFRDSDQSTSNSNPQDAYSLNRGKDEGVRESGSGPRLHDPEIGVSCRYAGPMLNEQDTLILCSGSHRRRCGECFNCIRDDCGTCAHCCDMPKFGGPNVIRQSCKLRKCLLFQRFGRGSY